MNKHAYPCILNKKWLTYEKLIFVKNHLKLSFKKL